MVGACHHINVPFAYDCSQTEQDALVAMVAQLRDSEVPEVRIGLSGTDICITYMLIASHLPLY